MDELLIWRWSTAVQITSALLITAFFVAYNRNFDHPALRLWVRAWIANGVALLITWAYWLLQPQALWALQFVTGAYLATKTAFVVLVVAGVRTFTSAASTSIPWRRAALVLVAGGAALAPLLRGVDPVGTLQATIIAAGFGYGAWLCWRQLGHDPGLGWLGLGLLLRALLGAAEALAYAGRALGGNVRPELIDLFLAAHSSLDTAAEWVIALGCVLALEQRMLAELSASHRELRTAYAELQRIAERDALTGAYDRRMLAQLVAAPSMRGGRLLFYDLDDFKRINDAYGHDVGDRSLRRFADALTAAFPEASGLVRFAGDEFIVLLPAGADVDVSARNANLRAALAAGNNAPAVGFSVGVTTIDDHADLRTLLRAADLDMYRDKRLRARPDDPG